MQLDAETIRLWITQAEVDLASLNAEAEQLQRRIAHVRSQLSLMYELLATVTDERVSKFSEDSEPTKSVRERVVDAVLVILRENGKPMRVQDIHAEFMRRELPLPGSGTPTNIAAHLVDRGLFTRPSRGVFGLVEWGSPTHPTTLKGPKARTRKR